MSAIVTFEQDPDARLDYEVDWTAWLGADTIVTSTWESSVPLVAIVEADTHDDLTAQVWVRLVSSVIGTKYLITNHIITANGRKNDQSFKVKIKQQ